MKLWKKVLSLGLTLSLLLSLMVVPGKADQNLTVSVNDVTVSQGEEFTANLEISNNPGFGSLTIRVYYKSDVLTCSKTGLGSDWTTYQMAGIMEGTYSTVQSHKPNDEQNISSDRTQAGWKMAAFGYATDQSSGATMNGVIGTMTFQVKSDLESCTTPIEIEVVKAADGTGDVVLTTSNRNATVSINGVTPTLNAVNLSNAAVTVDGSTDVPEISATATSAKGTDITGNVAWSVSPEGQGVTINPSTGKIAVTPKAVKGDYTITATTNGTTAQGTAKTATLKVDRAASEIRSIAIHQGETRVDDTATIIIPSTDTPNTYEYTVKSTDQYDDVAVVAEPTWDFTPADESGLVTFADGTVTVKKGATKNVEYTLKASVQTANGEKTAQTVLTVKDIDITWPEVPNPVNGTYGQTWAQIVTLGEGSASVAGTNVPGKFELADPDGIPNVTDTQYTVVFESDDGAYTVEQPFSAVIAPRNISNVTIADITAVDYTGNAQEPPVSVTDGDLLKETDYTVEYSNNINAGTATATIKPTAEGNYTGEGKTANFTITPAAVTLSAVTVPEIYANNDVNATASALTDYVQSVNPTVAGTFGTANAPVTFTATWTLTSGTWECKGGEYTYTAALSNDAGMDNFTVTAPTVNVKVEYVTAYQELEVKASTVKKANVESAQKWEDLGLPTSVAVSYLPVDANASTPATFEISGWEKTLEQIKAEAAKVEEGKDVTIEMYPDYAEDSIPAWADLGNKPVYALTITYKSPVTVEWTTEVADVTYGETLATPAAKQVAKDDGIDPDGTFAYTYEGINGTVYANSTEAPTDAGSYKVTATLNSATHSGTLSKDFTISPKALADSMVGEIADATYTGSVQEPAVVVTDGDKTLAKGTDYTVACENIDVGSATATITGIGNYSGTVTKTFAITAKALTAEDITVDNIAAVTYTGEEIKPDVTVRDSGSSTVLQEDTDYTAVYANNTDAGTATVTLTGKGNYSGTLEASFTINPAPITGSVVITIPATDTIAAGVELTADVSKLSSVGTATVAYEWSRVGEDGVIGTDKTYLVTDSDAGKSIIVKVTGTGNYTGTATSQSVAVGKKPMPDVKLTLSASVEPDTGKVIVTATVSIEMEIDEFNDNFWIYWFRDGIKVFESTVKALTAREAAQFYAEYPVGADDLGATISCLIVPKEDSEYTMYAAAETEPEDVGEVTDTDQNVDAIVNANGTVTIADKTVPNAPTGVTASVSGTDVTVKWTAPGKDGGDPITEYRITYTDANGKSVTEYVEDPSAETCILKNLPAGTYTITVAAVNGVGTGASAEAEGTVTISASTGGGGGGGGSWGSSNNTVSVTSTSHGSVSVSPRNPSKGTKVTLTLKPHKGYVLESVQVQDAKGATVELTKVSDTEYTFIMPGGKLKVNTSFVSEDEQNKPADTTFPFADAEDSWARDAIAWAYEKGYVNGTSATTFNPNGNITRQQMWMILARLSGQNPYNMAEARQWAMDNGVSDGTNGANAMTRQQMVTFLYRYAQLKGYELTGAASLDSYPDSATVSSYAQEPLAWAVGNSIVNGTNQGTLNPGGTATRAQFATILQRFYNGVVGE